MNQLPDSLKYDIIDDEPAVQEVITETGEVDEVPLTSDTSDSIPLEKPDDPEPDMPMFVPKPEPKAQDIFSEEKPKVKLTKKGRPRKPMSEEHKAKLAVAREKANAKRKFLAEQRKKNKAMAQEEKQLLQKKKEKEFQKLKQEVEQVESAEPEPEPETILTIPHKKESVHKPQVQYVGLTKEDLEKSHLDAILKVEAMRKERKAEKKKKAQIEEYNKETLKTLKKHTWRDTAGIYANAF